METTLLDEYSVLQASVQTMNYDFEEKRIFLNYQDGYLDQRRFENDAMKDFN